MAETSPEKPGAPAPGAGRALALAPQRSLTEPGAPAAPLTPSPAKTRLVRLLIGLRILGWLASWVALGLASWMALRVARHQPTTLAGVVHVALHGAPLHQRRVRDLPVASSERHQAARDLVADGLVKKRGEKVYRRLLADTPDHADLNFELGELLLGSARYRDAAEYLERTGRIDPTNGYAFARLAEAQIRLGAREAGLASRRRAKELGADLTRVDRDLAEIYLKEEHYEQAIRFFKSVDQGEALAQVQYLLALAYYEKGRPRYRQFRFAWDSAAYTEATRHLAKALELDPTMQDALALKEKL